MHDHDYILASRCPSVEEYLRLRAAAGLSAFSAEAARIGLPRSIFAVVVENGGQAVGMGRIIGDGGCFFQITDIAVDPSHQGKGLGKRIMAALTEHVQTALPVGAYVSLLADLPADALYRQFGFHATAPKTIGMAYRPR